MDLREFVAALLFVRQKNEAVEGPRHEGRRLRAFVRLRDGVVHEDDGDDLERARPVECKEHEHGEHDEVEDAVEGVGAGDV